MKEGDVVRIRKRKPKPIPNPHAGSREWDEWWEEGGIVVAEYNTWEKIVTILHEGKIIRIAASDVQLVSRNYEKDEKRVVK